jgi:hypothetical protein
VAIPSSRDCPSGSSRLGWQRTDAAREVLRDLVVRDAADELDAVASVELCAERPVADVRERPLAEASERVGKPHDVLPLRQ